MAKVAGTLLFADISGFTKLSERLAKKGKEGTEKLTQILNNYFGKLLNIIQKNGGEVLKFAGDALFIGFYDKNANPEKCANQIMKTKFPDISIKIVGISGEWNEFFIQKHLFLSGKKIKELALMEETAKPGDIILKLDNKYYYFADGIINSILFRKK